MMHLCVKAFSLYNSAAVDFSPSPEDRSNTKAWRPISNYFGSLIQLTKERFYEEATALKDELASIRNTLRREVDEIDIGAAWEDSHESLGSLARQSNCCMAKFAKKVIQVSVESMSEEPPCDFDVVGMGSLGRGEATPYSDIEYFFLLEESSASSKLYFQQLAVMTYFYIGSLKETKLSSLDIEELRDWFIDGRIKGFQIDGLTESSSNIPTGPKSSPNQMIARPSELAEVYKTLLVSPTDLSKKGDLTAMLRFTRIIHSSTSEGTNSLHSTFVESRQEAELVIPKPRFEANKAMLNSDLNRYSFSPEYDEYTKSFKLEIKNLVYRLPALLVLDLAVLLNQSGVDSWSTLEELQPNSLFIALKGLLAFACFCRLRCYLSNDRRDGNFGIENGQLNGAASVQDAHFVFQQCDVIWRMAVDEFFELSKGILSLQRFIRAIPLDVCYNTQDVHRNIRHDIGVCSEVLILSNFFSCKWSDVLSLAENLNSPISDLSIMFAIARSYLHRENYKQALDLYQDLSKREAQYHHEHRLEFARGISRCYEAFGHVPKAEETCRDAMSALTGHIEARHMALLRLQLTTLQMQTQKYAARNDKMNMLSLVFIALKDLMLDVATEGNPLSIDFISKSYEDRLHFLSNPSREIAHSLFIIGQLFEGIGESSLSKKYSEKAKSLCLKLVLDGDIDCVTKVTVLHGIGENIGDSRFLKYALEILSKSSADRETKTHLSRNILLTRIKLQSESMMQSKAGSQS